MGDGRSSISSSSSSATLKVPFFVPLGGGIFFLVDCTPCKDWIVCLLIVSTARGQYFAAFEYFSPVYVSKFSFFIVLSHVELTGNPDAACMYRTSSSTPGISYALYAEGVVFHFGVWYISTSSVGFIAKRHSLVSSFSL